MLDQHYYLGVDIGTTATKAVAVSCKGDVLAIESREYEMYHPQPGWSEQDPEEILEAVVQCINSLVASLSPQAPAFLCFSAAMHSVIAINDNETPLTASLIWADNRSADIATALRKTEQGKQFYQATGVPVHSMSPLCKLLWLKQYRPNVFSSSRRFIGIKEYVFLKLFGSTLVDTSLASATGLLNLEQLQWHVPILEYIGIRQEQLSPITDTKHVIYFNGEHIALKLPLHTPIVIGGSDGALSNLGTVGGKRNTLVATIGTSGAVRMTISKPQIDSQMRTFCYHVQDNDYIVGGATNNGAVVLQWLKESILQTEESYESLLQQAQTIPAGSGGLLFLPYLMGERAPIWNAAAKGVYFGLSAEHTKAHMVRAALEGVTYCLFSIARVLFEQQTSNEIYASGGFARSELWLQILADVFNKKVLVSGALESSAVGAIMLGAEAMGIALGFESKMEASYEPDTIIHEVYQQGFERFQKLYDLLKEEMK